MAMFLYLWASSKADMVAKAQGALLPQRQKTRQIMFVTAGSRAHRPA
jgi:hypothetical protein